jgi:plastocyanin
MKYRLTATVAAGALLATIALLGASSSLAQSDKTATIISNVTADNEVIVGGGNMTVSINTFSPSAIEIEAGETVTFRAAPGSTEIHNVIFDFSNGTVVSDVLVPFVPDRGHNHDYELVPPFNLGEPITQEQENGTKAIVAANKLAFTPSVVDPQGNVTYLIDEDELRSQLMQAFGESEVTTPAVPPQLSSNYTLEGSEKVLSSGIVLDIAGFFGGPPVEEDTLTGQTETSSDNAEHIDITGQNATTVTEEETEYPGPPFIPLSTFSVTFEEPGTYPFFCAFHPAMGGAVVVTEGQNDGIEPAP